VQRFFEYDLKNKTVLITGGSRGLGLVMAREFAAEGARLVLCARDEEELNREGKHALEYAWFSISDALPLLTVSAEKAARQIVRACKRGQSELVISIPAKVAVLFHALFPEMTSQLLARQSVVTVGGRCRYRNEEGKRQCVSVVTVVADDTQRTSICPKQ